MENINSSAMNEAKGFIDTHTPRDRSKKGGGSPALEKRKTFGGQSPGRDSSTLAGERGRNRNGIEAGVRRKSGSISLNHTGKQYPIVVKGLKVPLRILRNQNTCTCVCAHVRVCFCLSQERRAVFLLPGDN